MKETELLLNKIEQCKHQLKILETALKELQENCSHDYYIEEITHRICCKCNYVDSLYY
jgi:chaperonin cofactor prefoldin